MNIKRWFLNNSLRNYQYMLFNKKNAIAIDPLKKDIYLDFLTNNNLNLEAIIITHNHGDHIAGVKALKEKFPNTTIYAFEGTNNLKPDVFIKDNDYIELSDTSFKAIYTPGHTKEHICYLFENEKALFCGDMVFNAGIGGIHAKSADINELCESTKKILSLNKHVKLYPAHDYWKSNLEFALSIINNDKNFSYYYDNLKDTTGDEKPILTIEEEQKCNIFFRAFTDETLKQKFPNLSTDEIFKKLRILKNNF